ncbi:hypothetical protein F5Y07DRAFT_388384 [Xylaria sp. FL0933]|nr:hypothetical protein F5Y07DRAFT_388384 [Xylaria sp. FL0933]
MGVDDNPFIRFKNHIDNNLRRGWDIIVGSFPAPPTSSSTQPSTSESPTSTPSSSTTASTTSTQPTSSPSSMSDATTADQRTTSTTSLTSPLTSPTSSSSSHATTTTTSATTNSSSPNSTSTATIDDVHTWAVHSPYSPLNLTHLPQPRPRDAYPSSTAACYTFRDAFEDLLVTGSGEPLPALPWRQSWGVGVERNSDPFSFSPYFSFSPHGAANWVGGLGLSGLWDAYFDLRTEAGRKVRWGDWDRFLKRREERFGPFAAVAVVPDLRVGIGGWEGEREREEEGKGERDRDRDRGITGRARFDAKGIWDSAWRVRGGRWEEVDREEDAAHHRDQERRDGDDDADVEDELYRASDDDPPESSIEDLKRRDMRVTVDVPGGVRTSFPSPSSSSPSSSAPETTTTVYADGSKFVRKTERHERDGRAEISTTEYYYDAQGNLLSESHGVSKTHTWSGSLPGASAGASFSWSWNSAESSVARDGEGSGGERNGDGNEDGKAAKSGWFWRR